MDDFGWQVEICVLWLNIFFLISYILHYPWKYENILLNHLVQGVTCIFYRMYFVNLCQNIPKKLSLVTRTLSNKIIAYCIMCMVHIVINSLVFGTDTQWRVVFFIVAQEFFWGMKKITYYEEMWSPYVISFNFISKTLLIPYNNVLDLWYHLYINF